MFARDTDPARCRGQRAAFAADGTQARARRATLLNEQMFRSLGNALKHNVTVFLEDKTHDWDWRDGGFRYYTRIAGRPTCSSSMN